MNIKYISHMSEKRGRELGDDDDVCKLIGTLWSALMRSGCCENSQVRLTSSMQKPTSRLMDMSQYITFSRLNRAIIRAAGSGKLVRLTSNLNHEEHYGAKIFYGAIYEIRS